MLLALRKTPASDRLLDRMANWVIKARLVSDYGHAGIVIGDRLYHATSRGGLHVTTFTPANWELIDVGGDDGRALELFGEYVGAEYDWFSLLAFVGLRIRDSERMYCFEWCWLAMTGEHPKRRVTVENLLGLSLAMATQRDD